MNLPWKNIEWRPFEILTLHYAENLLPGTRFDDHLKQGASQDGIDLICRSQSLDRPVVVQCKRKENIGPAKIKALVTTFLDGQYAKPGTRFILATTADLHSRSMVKVLQEQQQRSQNEYNIALEWWDPQTMDIHLQRMYPLVAYFFSENDARRHCFPAAGMDKRFDTPPLDPALERQILPLRQDNHDPIRQLWQAANNRGLSLSNLFTNNRLAIRRICLVADPYQGKTSYLQQSAHELTIAGQQIQPLFLTVKDENTDPVDQQLTRRYDTWLSVPLKNLVIFIDGLDEAHGGDVLGFTKYVETFASQYPAVSIIISCRSAFFNHNRLDKQLKTFDYYGFGPLSVAGIDQYVKKCFDGHAAAFNKAVANKKWDSWLHHPFYLNLLIEEFRRKNKLPPTKKTAIEIFINEAWLQGQDRSFDKGLLADHAHAAGVAAQKLALTLQLLEQNTLDENRFQQLFPPDDRRLLQQSPIISCRDGNWTFTNAFFQEHLAAIQLREYPLKMITSLITVGGSIRKLRTRWLQTVYALLSLLDEGSALFSSLRQLIDDDNPELIFASESNLHTPRARLSYLDHLITYCRVNSMWPQLISYSQIGQFLTNLPEAVNRLTTHLRDNIFPISIKVVCCRILAGITDLAQVHEKTILDLVHEQLRLTADTKYAAELIAILSARGLGTKKDIQGVLQLEKFHQFHIFRDEVYEWMLSLGLTRQFWFYGIAGIPILINHNKPMTQGGSERNLENFLLTVERRSELYALFAAMRSPDWAEFYRHKGTMREGFISQLLQKCAAMLAKDPLTALPVLDFLRNSGRRYLQDDVAGLNAIIAHPAARDLLARSLGAELFTQKNWELSVLIGPDTLDYLLWEFEETEIPFTNLEYPLWHMHKRSADLDEKQYRKLIDQVSGNTLINTTDIRAHKRMQLLEQKRIDLDMQCIQSPDRFRNAIKHLFQLHKTGHITLDALYAERTGPIRASSGHFITEFLHQWIMLGYTISLADALTFLEKEDNFLFFRATEILNYTYAQDRITTELLPLLREYYYTELPTCDFARSAVAWSAGQTSPREDLIVTIFAKHHFPTETDQLTEFLWMDHNGFISRPSYGPPQDLLRNHIRDALGKNASIIMKDAILAHLKAGIPAHGVLAAHLDLCAELNIEEAQRYALDAVVTRMVPEQDFPRAIDIFVELNGAKSLLLPIFDHLALSDVLFLHLLNLLADEYPGFVLDKAKTALQTASLSAEENVRLAKLIASIGDITGFEHLVGILRETNNPNVYYIRPNLARIDTTKAISLLNDTLSVFVDPAFENARGPENPRLTVWEWITALAEKGEPDLLLVLHALEKAEQHLANHYPDVINLRWYSFRLLEKLRDIQRPAYTIPQIKAILGPKNTE